MNELTEKDHQLLVRKGITEATLNAQVARFKQGVPPIQLVKAAVIDDGILPLTKEDAAKYAAIYQKRKKGNKIVKFVLVCLNRSLLSAMALSLIGNRLWHT